jgi:hypothetical protein
MGWISNYLPKGFLDYKNCDLFVYYDDGVEEGYNPITIK